MKHISFYILSIVVLLSSSCVFDSTTDCNYLKNNLKLEFVNINKDGDDLFEKNIKRVHVFIFDESYLFVQKKIVEQPDLDIFHGTEMNLPTGHYYIVCWGNALDKTSFIDFDSSTNIFDAFVKNSMTNSALIAPNGDPLYYAPKPVSELLEVTITSSEQVVKKVPFQSAHARLNVYVKGMEDLSEKGELLAPVLTLDNIPNSTDFQLNTSNSYIKYQNIADAVDTEDKKMFMYRFDTPLLDDNTLMNLYVNKQSNQEELAIVNISQFIREHNIQYQGVDQIEVVIQVEFKGTEVLITLPNWEYVPVDPEL